MLGSLWLGGAPSWWRGVGGQPCSRGFAHLGPGDGCWVSAGTLATLSLAGTPQWPLPMTWSSSPMALGSPVQRQGARLTHRTWLGDRQCLVFFLGTVD